MEDELPLLVSVHTFTDHFTCSICMNTMKDTAIAYCGHRYCGECIKEWVGRTHKCPCCNKTVTTEQLIKDHQFDSLIECVYEEKEKSETQYFESLINTAVSNDSSQSISLSPVEKVLRDHLRESLAAHEKYFQNMKKQQFDAEKRLEQTCETDIADLSTHGLTVEELAQQTEDLKNRLSRQMDEIQKEFDSCTQLIADAFDKYLSNHIPRLDVLPVKANVCVIDKELTVTDVLFHPLDSVELKVKAAVEATMEARNDPVTSWADDISFVLFGPFAKCSHFEMQKIVNDVLHHGKTYPGVEVLDKSTKPVLQQSMKPGSEIVICGDVKLKSDMPKQCFVQMFKAGMEQPVDYFKCTQCKFQWICRSCMETCHRGHETAPYILNHKPAWACCYCPKKKTCKIQNVS